MTQIEAFGLVRLTPPDGSPEAVRALEAAKASTSEIARTVEDYMNVLVDWRQEQVEMPKGNPWSWSYRGTPGLYQASKEEMVNRL